MTTRALIIAGNWKMNTTTSDAVTLVSRLRPKLEDIDGVEKVFCPPFISLIVVRELLKGSSIKLGAQNLFYQEKGAYTGEVSAKMLVELCQFVIVGHSERRQYFKENDDIINRKMIAAQKAGLRPILCIGESLVENEAGQTKNVVAVQLKVALAGIDNIDGLVIAYEPVWAIGSGRAASGPKANNTISFIRQVISNTYGDVAHEIPILYGGSVTAENITEFIKQPEIDGALVGGASLKSEQFIDIIRKTAEIKGKSSPS
jgi:triosephosphate isomerase